MKLLIFLLGCSIFSSTSRISTNPEDTLRTPQIIPVMELINGLWFNGEFFEKKTVWINDGKITFHKPAQKDTVIDLENKFIIPPFAEAHNHNLESDYKIEERINSYLNDGVFYVKMMSSIKKRIAPLMHYYNKPSGLDISLAHAPLTGPGGHPIGLRKNFLDNGYFEGEFETLQEIEEHGYFVLENADNLNDKWHSIMSFSPDFIKIMILYSEEYQLRKNDTSYFGKKGLDPNLIPRIVSRVHKNGLRVSAHVATSYDFQIAVQSGVDEIAHLPGIHNGQRIEFKDAKLAEKKNITVITTATLVNKDKEQPNFNELLKNIKCNLSILKNAGVNIAVGSDTYIDTSLKEFEFLRDLEIFSNLELLKMWCENSAKTIFPDRKIGELKEGYEASFLALKSNPLKSLENINKNIVLKVKQGLILN